MIKNDRQLGAPFGLFSDTKANIEALTGLTGGETAYATDTGDDGVYDAVGSAWVWGRSGGGGGGTPGGSDTHIQYNDDGTFGGDAGFRYDATNKVVKIGENEFNTTDNGVLLQGGDTNSVGHYMETLGIGIASYITGIRGRGEVGDPDPVQADDVIFRIRGRAYDDAGVGQTSAEVRLVATETHSSSAHGADVEIHATPNGSTTLEKIATIDEDGINLESGKTFRVNGEPLGSGWFPVDEMWTRTGNHTFTVSGDLTTKYRKGRFVRYRDGGSDEYGVIDSSSHSSGTTTVNLVPNTNYAMAAATITNTFLALSENADGLPGEFDFAPSFTNLSLGSATVLAKWKSTLDRFRVHIIFNSTTISGTVTMATPFSTAPIIGFPRVPVGIATYLDASPLGTTLGNVVISAANTVLLQAVNAAGTYATIGGLSSTIPFTWANSDEMSFFAVIPS